MINATHTTTSAGADRRPDRGPFSLLLLAEPGRGPRGPCPARRADGGPMTSFACLKTGIIEQRGGASPTPTTTSRAVWAQAPPTGGPRSASVPWCWTRSNPDMKKHLATVTGRLAAFFHSFEDFIMFYKGGVNPLERRDLPRAHISSHCVQIISSDGGPSTWMAKKLLGRRAEESSGRLGCRGTRTGGGCVEGRRVGDHRGGGAGISGPPARRRRARPGRASGTPPVRRSRAGPGWSRWCRRPGRPVTEPVGGPPERVKRCTWSGLGRRSARKPV